MRGSVDASGHTRQEAQRAVGVQRRVLRPLAHPPSEPRFEHHVSEDICRHVHTKIGPAVAIWRPLIGVKPDKSSTGFGDLSDELARVHEATENVLTLPHLDPDFTTRLPSKGLLEVRVFCICVHRAKVNSDGVFETLGALAKADVPAFGSLQIAGWPRRLVWNPIEGIVRPAGEVLGSVCPSLADRFDPWDWPYGKSSIDYR